MVIESGIKRLAALAVIALLIFSLFAKVNFLRGQMIALEVGISNQYLVNQNQLSSYVLGFAEQTQIADREVQQLGKILKEAIAGRYDNSLDAQSSPALYSAIKEAYPQVELKSYSSIVQFIRANREAFRGQQSILLDKLRNYQSFRNGDIIDSFIVAQLGFPSSQLRVSLAGGQTLLGEAALVQIERIITDDTTRASFADGSMKPLRVAPVQ